METSDFLLHFLPLPCDLTRAHLYTGGAHISALCEAVSRTAGKHRIAGISVIHFLKYWHHGAETPFRRDNTTADEEEITCLSIIVRSRSSAAAAAGLRWPAPRTGQAKSCTIAQQMGHTDVATTRKLYYYSNKNRQNKQRQIEAAISF